MVRRGLLRKAAHRKLNVIVVRESRSRPGSMSWVDPVQRALLIKLYSPLQRDEQNRLN